MSDLERQADKARIQLHFRTVPLADLGLHVFGQGSILVAYLASAPKVETARHLHLPLCVWQGNDYAAGSTAWPSDTGKMWK